MILTDADFNRYGSTLQHIDDHRISTNPQPVIHEYPTEYAKVVPLDQGHTSGHRLPGPLSLPVPVVATHHHIHHHGNSQQYDHVEHGHAVLHNVGNDYAGGQDNYAPVTPTKTKPFFGIKIPQFFGGHKMNFHPILKGLWSGRYGGSQGQGSSQYKRQSNPISWQSIEQHH